MNTTDEQRDTLTLLIASVKALQDRVVTPKEGAVICQLMIQLADSVKPLVASHWYLRVVIYGMISMLNEAKDYLNELDTAND